MKDIAEEQLRWAKIAVAVAIIGIIVSAVLSLKDGGGFSWIIPVGTFVLGGAAGFFARGLWQRRSAKPNPLGLSPAALERYRVMEQSDIDRFKSLCSISLVDEDGRYTNPLIVRKRTAALDLVALKWGDIERLADLNLVKIVDVEDRKAELVEGYREAEKLLRDCGKAPDAKTVKYCFKNRNVNTGCPVEFAPTHGLFSNHGTTRITGWFFSQPSDARSPKRWTSPYSPVFRNTSIRPCEK